jgi:SAM-dependent methyltransferase
VAGTVEHLPAVMAVRTPDRLGGAADHPMRHVTHRVAAGEWDDGLKGTVRQLFDELASEWHTRDEEGRLEPLADAIERGGLAGDALVAEVGSGTGLVTPMLTERFPSVVALDISEEMLRRAPPAPAPRVRADQAALPLAARSIDVVAHINAFLFPAEVDRVLAPNGSVLWVCTRGEHTPIFLTAEEVVAALPGSWTARTSTAGAGTWTVARRS